MVPAQHSKAFHRAHLHACMTQALASVCFVTQLTLPGMGDHYVGVGLLDVRWVIWASPQQKHTNTHHEYKLGIEWAVISTRTLPNASMSMRHSAHVHYVKKAAHNW